MHIETILLLGIATNLDNLCVGMSYGLSKKSIPWYANAIIALLSGGLAMLACAFAQLFAGTYALIAKILGSILLLFCGIWTIRASIRAPKSPVPVNPTLTRVTFRQTLLLGLVLSLNCLAAACGVGLSDVSPIGVGISLGLFSFLAVAVGNWVGKNTARRFSGRVMDLISGLIFIGLAVWEWLI